MSLPENPTTRNEIMLSVMAGQSDTSALPPDSENDTREQQYLRYIAVNGGGGGGGDVTGVKGSAETDYRTGNVTISAANVDAYTKSEVNTLLNGKISNTAKGTASGVAELDSNGKVPSSQLPSYVDDVIEGYLNTVDGKFYEDSSYTTEITGTTGKIYVSLDTEKCYRWSGSAFVEISESLALGETSSTAYAGNKGKANADAITAIKDGVNIDSFGDVETALADKVSKSNTAGLLKNDGTVDTTAYQPSTMSASVTIGAETETTVEDAIGELAGITPSNAGTSNKLSTASDTAARDISASSTGTSFSLTDAADGNVQNFVIKGRTDSTTAASVGENGLIIQTSGKNLYPFGDQTVDRAKYLYPIYIPKGDYVVSARVVTDDTEGSLCRFAVCDMNDNIVSYCQIARNTRASNTISIPDDLYGKIILYAADNYTVSAGDTATWSDIQLELGSTATAYEPYHGSSATITTAMPLCSLSEALTDEVDMLAGVVRKKCKSVDLGDFEWVYDDGYFQAADLNNLIKRPTDGTEMPNIISEGYTANQWDGTTPDKSIIVTPTGVSRPRILWIKDTSYTDAATFKTAVTGKKLVFELATPYDAPLTPAEMTALTNLKTYSGTTNISATDSPAMTVDYLLNTDNGQACADMQADIKNSMGALSAMIANEYDSTATYSVGDYVIYIGVLYRCTTAVSTAEPFDSTKWAATNVTTELISARSDIDYIAMMSNIDLG